MLTINLKVKLTNHLYKEILTINLSHDSQRSSICTLLNSGVDGLIHSRQCKMVTFSYSGPGPCVHIS